MSQLYNILNAVLEKHPYLRCLLDVRQEQEMIPIISDDRLFFPTKAFIEVKKLTLGQYIRFCTSLFKDNFLRRR